MPQSMTVTAPNGKTLTIQGDHVPTEAELHDIFAKAGVDTKAPATPAATTSGPSWMRSTAEAAIPNVGGAVGGFVGGIPGAAIGGAAGEGYRQIAAHVEELPGAVRDVARGAVEHPIETATGFARGAAAGVVEAGKEAGLQGAFQGAGDLAVRGAGIMSKWLMNRATTRVSAKLMQDFPDLTDTLIDKALTVSKGGYEKARSMLLAAKADATIALRKADASGARIPIQLTDDLAESLKTALLEKAIKSGTVKAAPGTPLTVASQRLDPATAALFQQIDAAANGGVFHLAPSQADVLKTQLQKESRLLYANRTAPNGQRAMGMDATERAEFASRLNEAIDTLATGYKSANAAARPLIGAVRGIQQATRPNGNLYQALVRPAVGAAVGTETGRESGGKWGAIAGGAAGAAMTSPAGMSREAIVLAHPAMQAILRQVPRSTAGMIVEFVRDHLPSLIEPATTQP